MNRYQAFLTHFLISLAVVGSLAAIIFFIWYPAPYFEVVGAIDVLMVLLGVDLVLGPLLTFIVFKPGKPSLKFDLTVIALIQISALVYGGNVIYQERPYFTVFAVDRFEVLASKDVDFNAVPDARLLEKPWIGTVFAVSELPADEVARSDILLDVALGGGLDIEQRPELWSVYADRMAVVREAARPVSELAGYSELAARLVDNLGERGAGQPEWLYVPIMNRRGGAFSLVLDPESLRPVDLLRVDPWTGSAATASDG